MSTAPFLQKIAAIVGAVALLAAGGWLRHAVTPEVEASQAPGWADLEQIDGSASASLLGELRGSFADYLWMKADRLVHNGVELRPLTSHEKRDARRWQASEAAGHSTPVARHEDEGTTVVPNQEADHRSILGNLEREIKPFMDMRNHTHRDPGETAALFRLMTWANPRFIPGWVVGANVLAEEIGEPKKALAFLKEGMEKNPDSVEIHTEVGRYLLYTFKDTPAAEKHFRQAIRLGERQPKLRQDEAEAWETAHRWLVIQYNRFGRRQEARDMALLAIRRFPESLYFRRALERVERGEKLRS
jgi:tetratricopeptide (TPR) repeat protein